MTDAKPPKRPAPPADLGSAGRRLWREIASDLAPELEFDARDLVNLREASAIADTIAELEAAVKRDGAVLAGKNGPRTHPAVTELRQARVALMRLLASVQLDDRVGVSPTSRRAQNAANVRWTLEREKHGRRAA